MKYTDYYERVSKDEAGYAVEAVYEFGNVGLEYGATVDTVTAAHAKLREFRADFRQQVEDASKQGADNPSVEAPPQGV